MTTLCLRLLTKGNLDTSSAIPQKNRKYKACSVRPDGEHSQRPLKKQGKLHQLDDPHQGLLFSYDESKLI